MRSRKHKVLDVSILINSVGLMVAAMYFGRVHVAPTRASLVYYVHIEQHNSISTPQIHHTRSDRPKTLLSDTMG